MEIFQEADNKRISVRDLCGLFTLCVCVCVYGSDCVMCVYVLHTHNVHIVIVALSLADFCFHCCCCFCWHSIHTATCSHLCNVCVCRANDIIWLRIRNIYELCTCLSFLFCCLLFRAPFIVHLPVAICALHSNGCDCVNGWLRW